MSLEKLWANQIRAQFSRTKQRSGQTLYIGLEKFIGGPKKLMTEGKTNSMDDEAEPHQEEPLKLDLWFANPISELLNNRTEISDGGFLVLSGALALYERYLVKKFPGLDASGKNYIERDTKWGGDLGLEQPHFSAFWDCFRNGLQHQFQPKTRCGKTKYEWSLSSHYGAPKVEAVSEKLFRIEINPWSFAALVREKYSDNQELMNTCDSHKLGEIRPLKEGQQMQSTSEALPVPTFRVSHPNLSPNPKSPKYQMDPLETGNFSPTPKPQPLAEVLTSTILSTAEQERCIEQVPAPVSVSKFCSPVGDLGRSPPPEMDR